MIPTGERAQKLRLFFIALSFSILFQSCGDGSDSTFLNCAVNIANDQTGSEVGIAHTDFVGDAVAQSFQVTETTTVSSVAIALRKTGSPSGTLTLRIEADSSDAPNGTLIDSNATATLAASQVLTSPSQFYTFTFGGDVTFVTSLTYWVRVAASYTSSNTDLIQWLGNNSDVYSLGQAKYKTGALNTWADTLVSSSRDVLFRMGCQ